MRITNTEGFPAILVRACEGFNQPPMPHILRVTELIDSPLIKELKVKYWDELEDDVSERLWALLGSATHSLIEGHRKDERTEDTLQATVDGQIIRGTSDLYEDGLITDWKTTSVWSIIYPDQKYKWEQQLNVYRYLFEVNGAEVSELQVIAILRDWQKSKARLDPSYPQSAVVTVPIPMWTIEHTLSFISERIGLFQRPYVCNAMDRWTKPTVFAVMKGANKRATKLFDDKAEAEEFAATNKDFSVVERPGVDSRCEDYCPVRAKCTYRRITPSDL